MSAIQKSLLTFVHIEKSAGTTFNHILRHNFLFSYLDVRPLSKYSYGVFTHNNLNISRKIVPGLRCIAGHSIKPYHKLEKVIPEIQYITILRNPVKRYISQYQHWIERMGKKLSFEEYLTLDEVKNFQVKKIAGSENIEMAKNILAEKFYLIGFVENFDEFLVLLSNKISHNILDFRYQQQNRAKNKFNSLDLETKFKAEIELNNRLDIELYKYVESVLYPKYITDYGSNFLDDVVKFKYLNETTTPAILHRYFDYAFRKFYINPAIGIIRLLNGLPAKGSY